MQYPIRLSVKSELFPILIIILSWSLAFYFYANFPDQVPTHWNIAGEADNYSSKGVGAFMIPGVITGIYALFLVLPLIDPRGERYADFSKAYHILKNAIVALVFGVYVVAGVAGLGYAVPVGILTPLGIGFLFLVIGNYMGKVKSNWLMGVRTPWTLSNEEVWNKTHRLSGKLFIVGGVTMALTGLIPISLRLPAFIAVIVIVGLVPMIYSYLLYKKIHTISG